jgi:hypothetical protein
VVKKRRHFCGNYAHYFMLTWLPLLLVRAHGFRVNQMAVIGACVYALQAIGAPDNLCVNMAGVSAHAVVIRRVEPVEWLSPSMT